MLQFKRNEFTTDKNAPLENTPLPLEGRALPEGIDSLPGHRGFTTHPDNVFSSLPQSLRMTIASEEDENKDDTPVPVPQHTNEHLQMTQAQRWQYLGSLSPHPPSDRERKHFTRGLQFKRQQEERKERQQHFDRNQLGGLLNLSGEVTKADLVSGVKRNAPAVPQRSRQGKKKVQLPDATSDANS